MRLNFPYYHGIWSCANNPSNFCYVIRRNYTTIMAISNNYKNKLFNYYGSSCNSWRIHQVKNPAMTLQYRCEV